MHPREMSEIQEANLVFKCGTQLRPLPMSNLWFCCRPTVFSRLFAIQEHVVIHLNCFYRIQGLIVDSFFRCSCAENLELAARRYCFGCSFVVVH